MTVASGSTPASSRSGPSSDAAEPLPHEAVGEQGLHGLRALVVADSDSRWKWATCVAEDLARRGMVLEGGLIEGPSAPTDRQLAEVGARVGAVTRLPLERCARPELLAGYDVVIIGCTGGGVFGLLQALAEMDVQRRPVVVTGYPGLVFEREIEGLLWRIGADLICVNSERDEARLGRYLDLLGADRNVLVRTGLPSVRGRVQPRTRPVRSMMFVVQPTVPRSRADRVYILHRLVEYAQAWPERRVVVKLRAQPNEATTHPEPHHYEVLLAEERLPRPANMEFSYGYMPTVLASVDLCVTVSSTAAIEALSMGVPTAVLTDFGVAERLGNHLFLGSGCLASFADLIADRVPVASSAWLERNGLGVDDRLETVGDRVAGLVDRRRMDGGVLPMRELWLAPGRTDALLDAHALRFAPVGSSGAGLASGFRAGLKRSVRAVLGRFGRFAYRHADRWLS